MIAGILGCSGCGGTFLDWSLHYLAGDDAHWTLHCDLDRRLPNPDFLTAPDVWAKYASRRPVPAVPFLGLAAHAHAKTHPTWHTLPRVLEQFATHNRDSLQTFYYFDNLDADQHQTMHNRVVQQYPHVKFVTYTYQRTDIDIIFCMQFEKLPRMQEFYTQALAAQLSDHETWTKREIFALAYEKKLWGQTCAEKIQPADNNYVLQFQDFFYHLPEVIHSIFDFLNMPWQKQRWSHWLEVYKQYQSNNNVQFYMDLPMIVASIVNNQSWDLSKYNMTFAKEVVLSRHLLYNHNYTLQAHGLERMGTNAQDWYRVLEPNIYHTLDEELT